MSNTVIYTFQHNGETIVSPPAPVTMTREEIQAQAAIRWPEVANATMNVSASNVITFTLPTASKQ